MNVEKFMEQLLKDTAVVKKLVDENGRMRIINRWREKPTKQCLDYTHKRGVRIKSDVEYLAGMFSKAGVSRDSGYQFAKDKLFRDGMDESAFKKEFDDEFYANSPDEDWIKKVFTKK